ncbi:MAG: DNA/RNA nuclease SfsA [bacterium]|nr:MAG: DNA/RNA nuclease SfsA [bacterium]
MIRIHTFDDLHPGILLRRYKRFLADVRLDDGRTVTAFTPNSGSMLTCSDPGSPVMLSYQGIPGRKTDYTLEMVRTEAVWVGVNTLLANELGARIVSEGLTGKDGLEGFTVEGREYTYGDSRLDLVLTDGASRCLAEVKNVTLRENDTARFPDARTARGKKHLLTLIDALSEGYLACMLYIVQRSDCSRFGPARDIDPDYAQAFDEAVEAGVKVLACSLEVGPSGIFYVDTLPLTVPSLP